MEIEESRTEPEEPLSSILSQSMSAARKIQGGAPADYIPQLASVQPDLLGIAVCSLDGTLETSGDAGIPLTMQSLCKPFLYGIALAELGADRVHEVVGVEPTGQEFNSFTRLESGSKRPHNPMVNAGAIGIVDLLLENSSDPTSGTSIVESLARFTGRRDLSYDRSVYESERAHASRNRVIAHLMKHFGLIRGDVETVLDAYFRICSLIVTCRDLGIMAGCLANDGRNPKTTEQVLSRDVVDAVLTVMTTCGMYDSSGAFAYEVGLPAKSGVSGGILAVEPGRYGIAVYSPRVDRAGNSVRGWSILRSVSEASRGHLFDVRPRWTSLPQAETVRNALVEAASDVESERVDTEPAEPAGEPASYLPPVDRSTFGMAVCTVRGDEESTGEGDLPFSLQAIANPLAFTFALEQFGSPTVRDIVGVEPSGNPFHAIVIDQRIGRPYNPLGNAGALAVSGLNSTDPSWYESVATSFAALAGSDQPFAVDETVLEAEWKHADRNRAIAHLLHEAGALPDVDDALRTYFRQCSLLVTCAELARIGATLAHGGVSPISGQRVLGTSAVQKALAVMYTCGMHDQSGLFALEVGLPAKSGVSGAILAVVPGRMGIAAYSPAVDASGTSVRGRRAVEAISSALELSVFAGNR